MSSIVKLKLAANHFFKESEELVAKILKLKSAYRDAPKSQQPLHYSLQNLIKTTLELDEFTQDFKSNMAQYSFDQISDAVLEGKKKYMEVYYSVEKCEKVYDETAKKNPKALKSTTILQNMPPEECIENNEDDIIEFE